MLDIVLLIENRNITQNWHVTHRAFEQLKKVDGFLSSLHLASLVVRKLRSQSISSCSRHANYHSYLTSYIRENTSLMHCTQGVGGSARLLSCWFSYGGLLVSKQREGTTDVRLCISCEMPYWGLAESSLSLGVKALYGNRSNLLWNVT